MNLNPQELQMLKVMVGRGWAGGDLAEYLEADQIAACLRVLEVLGISQSEWGQTAARTPPQRRQTEPQADARAG